MTIVDAFLILALIGCVVAAFGVIPSGAIAFALIGVLILVAIVLLHVR